MTKQTTKAKAANTSAITPVAPVAPVVAVPTLSADTVLRVATDYVEFAKQTEAASATFVSQTRMIARGIGQRLTFADFYKLFLPALKEVFATSGLSEDRIREYCTRFRVIACALLTGDPAFDPHAGEGRDPYMTRVRGPLDAYVFADGVPMVAVNPVTGKASKRGRKAGSVASNAKAAKPSVAAATAATEAAKAPATPHPLSAAKADDKGLDVKPALASACILTGEDPTKAHPVATLAQRILTTQGGRDAFAAWAETFLDAERAKATVKATAYAAGVAKAKATKAKPNGAGAH